MAAATETNKRTAGVFLDTLGELAYKEIKKNGEFVLPGFGKLVKQKRKAKTYPNGDEVIVGIIGIAATYMGELQAPGPPTTSPSALSVWMLALMLK